SWCQGIHRTLFITYNKDARVHCAVLKQHTTNHVLVATEHQKNPAGMTTMITCKFLPRKNTRVFPQDPTVHRYITRRPIIRSTVTRESLSVFHP
ncbi:hypothetical protein, partial [Rhodococcus opacus]|uniref:hypothetical protein n=1 Tax=Rhodococcus opacus TaxID=37919 RepID=UPI002473CC1C